MPKEVTNWSAKLQDIFHTCQSEISKTTSIGKKMLRASKTSTTLQYALKELGQLAADEMRQGKLKWDNPHALNLVQTIEKCNNNLYEIEHEVKEIKFPEDNDQPHV
ncbi:MAG: hypothetical protein ISR65_01065 [Bacteriovoracaceae bacterium]|nr:hypothetical protein [Bacteriovoracaceae bacterium]